MDANIVPDEGKQDAETKFLKDVLEELLRAKEKYPAPNSNTSALAGEAGEACEAMGKEPFANVYAECVQTAVMAMRLAVEGDPYLDVYRAENGLDASVKEQSND